MNAPAQFTLRTEQPLGVSIHHTAPLVSVRAHFFVLSRDIYVACCLVLRNLLGGLVLGVAQRKLGLQFMPFAVERR